MIDLFDSPNRSRKKASRRHFLKVGGLAAGGLSLPQLLAAEDAQKVGSSHKAIINIYLPGGPPHLDMFDMKPDAPREIRGEFNPIKSNVPGMEFCELFPNLAKCADKFAIIRSLADCDGRHDPHQCMTGRKKLDPVGVPPGGWPNFGAWVSKLQKSRLDVPANVAMMYPSKGGNWGDPYGGGFIGHAHSPMNLVEKDPNAKLQNLSVRGITLDRLEDRSRLRNSLQQFQRSAEALGQEDGIDIYHQKALNILAGSKLNEALDLSKEDPKVVERYGVNDPVYTYDGPPKMIRNFLIALRLVEAGARVVSLNFSRWDWHGTADLFNFKRAREDFPDARQRTRCDARRHAFARVGQRCRCCGVGRVWADSEAQQTQQSRSLAQSKFCPDGRRRDEHRPGHRRDRQYGRPTHRETREISGSFRDLVSLHRY